MPKRKIICDAFVIDVTEHVILVQYESNNNIYRRYIPRELFNTNRKNQPVQIPCEVLELGIEYSDVILSEGILGEVVTSKLSISEMEQAFRRAGLWLRADYRKNIQAVNKILTQNGWRKYVDAQTVVNAALHDN